jgi:hypothetical protein
MSQTVRYQKYIINSSPQQSLNGGRWKLTISIAWQENGASTMKSFTTDTPYQTESEADVHGITFGQRIIDGKIPGISLS